MTVVTDFTKLDDQEIAQFVQDNHVDFNEPSLAGKAQDILDALKLGTIIQKRVCGFAVIHPVGSTDAGLDYSRTVAVLWYFYVAPEYRRPHSDESNRFGHEVAAYLSAEGPSQLLCNGEFRRKFFEKLGFRVTPRDPDGNFVMSLPASLP